MHRHLNILLISGLALPLLSACEISDKGKADTKQTSAQRSDTQAETPATLVVETATPTPTAPVVQTQPGPEGAAVDLNKAAVIGEVLTVQVTVRGSPNRVTSLYMDNDQISVIDDSTAQRYSLLKDSSGAVMASPTSGSTRIGSTVGRGSSKVFWFKFPAPPATSPTVSINLPNVGPFDGVPVTR